MLLDIDIGTATFLILTQSIDSFYDYFNDILGTSRKHDPDDPDDR